MAIRAVIFDIGGVLIRREDESKHRKWEARLGLKRGELYDRIVLSEAAAQANIGRISEAEVWKYVAMQFGLDDEQVHKLERDFWAGTQLDVTLLQFLRSLRPRYKTALLSNAWSGAREVHTHAFGLIDAVDVTMLSAELGVAKPDPRIYQIAIQRLAVQPQEALFVDDVPDNLYAAHKAGIHIIQFRTTVDIMAAVQSYLEREEKR